MRDNPAAFSPFCARFHSETGLFFAQASAPTPAAGFAEAEALAAAAAGSDADSDATEEVAPEDADTVRGGSGVSFF